MFFLRRPAPWPRKVRIVCRRNRGVVLLLLIVPVLFAAHCTKSRNIAIDRAIQYVNRRGENLQQVAVPMLDSLQRRFAIAVDITAAKRRILAATPSGRRVFFRYLGPNLTATQQQITQLTGIDRVTATALYCDLYKLPPDYFKQLRSLAGQGGYALTHATLAMVMVRGKNCSYDRAEYARELRRQISGLRWLLHNTPVDSDLGIEAILMLHLSRQAPEMAGEPSHVNPVWIEQIMAAQSPDGSWYQNDHTTVLALWLLLELKNI